MAMQFPIALYTTMLDTEHSRLGHLWHRAKNSQPPDWYGQPWPELDRVFVEQSVVHRVGTHEFSIASEKHKRKSAGILSSVLRSFGVLDFQMERLRSRSFVAKVTLNDYVRPTLSLAALSRLLGYTVPPTYSGGHWFACHAQHQATSGSLELAYDRSDGYDLAAELEARGNSGNTALPGARGDNGGAASVAQAERVADSGDEPEAAAQDSPSPIPQPSSREAASPIPHPASPAGSLHVEDQSSGIQLFSFSAVRPLVFGISLQHLWEKDGKLASFGNKHEDLEYAGS
ncbi:hypothetical protein KDL29_12035 [bacterium]|nr:hypothetical protein [bacterium]